MRDPIKVLVVRRILNGQNQVLFLFRFYSTMTDEVDTSSSHFGLNMEQGDGLKRFLSSNSFSRVL